MHEVMENTGIFDSYEMTTLVSFDTESTSMMLELDSINLQKNLDSISDQIIDFNSDDCKLTKGLMPQMGLTFTPKPFNHWQSLYLKKHVTSSFRSLLQQIDSAQKQHYARKDFKLDEDPWENYLFHDTKLLVTLICHSKALSISQQVILAKFIEHSIKMETISQY